jgi:hypothetical protein
MEDRMKRKSLFFAFILLAILLILMNCSSSPPPSELPPSEPPKYTIILPNDLQNGKITVDSDSAAEGKNVQLTVNITSGYQLKSLIVEDDSGRKIAVSGNSKSWNFTMPSSNVTVNVILDPPIPLTKELLIKLNSELNIRTLNYYISEGVALINEETSELYTASDGAVRRQSRNESETITIKKGTSGLMTTNIINESDPIILGICFDENSENLVLNFRENADGNFYVDIETEREDKKIQYGSKRYVIQYSEPPKILIQYGDRLEENSKNRELRGRSIGGNN